MADLKEAPIWEKGIYQLEESDPVIGGPNGIDNLQAKQLGNRTQFLNKKISEISDKFQSYEFETLVRSPGKSCHLVLRDNTFFGIYSYDIENFKWSIDEKGVFSGRIQADNVNGINELIESKLVFNSSIDNTAENQIATPLAVKKAYDFAASVKSVADAAITKSDNAQHTADIAHNIAVGAVKKGDELHYHGALGDKIINNLRAAEHGVYFQNSYSDAYPERGYPIRESGALTILKTEGDGDQGCAQIYTLYKSGRQFIRNYRGNAKSGFWEPWVEQINTTNINDYLPVGIPLPWPQVTPPTGWLKCNGWQFDKNKYPKLAQAYPSGYLPELRGETVRGWDDGRGVDRGRQILSWQSDAIRNIWGEISPISETFASEPIATGVFKYFEKHAGHTPTGIDAGSVGGVVFDASNLVPTAHENRVRSVAFLYIVKAE